jgi:hypothetical protein
MNDNMLRQALQDASASPQTPARRRGEAASTSRAVARTFAVSHAIAFVALGLMAGCGKGAKGDCPQLEICGGNPASNTPWQVFDYCQVPVVRPSQAGDVNDFQQMTPPLAPTVAPPQPNPVVAQQTTSGDWCSSLVLKEDLSVANVSLWHASPHISHDLTNKPSTIIIAPDHTYLTKLELDEEDATHFDPRCLVQNGAAMPTCTALGKGLSDFYKSQNPVVPAAFTGPGGTPDMPKIACTGDALVTGCDCSYTFNLEIEDSGTWAIDPTDSTVLVQDSTVLQFNGQTMNAAASTTTLRTSFCVDNNGLSLSGLRGGSISNVQGLRTLGLGPMMMMP